MKVDINNDIPYDVWTTIFLDKDVRPMLWVVGIVSRNWNLVTVEMKRQHSPTILSSWKYWQLSCERGEPCDNATMTHETKHKQTVIAKVAWVPCGR